MLIQLDDIINKRYALKNLSDTEFLDNLDSLANQLSLYDYRYSYSDEDLIKDFNSLIKFKNDSNSFAATNRAGMKISEHFMQNFWNVENWDGNSFAKEWKNTATLKKVLVWNRNSHSTPYISELRRGVYFVSKLPKTTMFRPGLTKIICDKFNSSVVLDPCCGWGGRMLGVACNPSRKYIGFDPNTETFNNLIKIKEFFKLKNVEIYCEPAEVGIEKLKERVDCVITSPPYFNLEVYNHESTQSITQKSYGEWKEKFLKKIISDSIKLLKSDGVSCWNVANGSTNEKFNLVEDVEIIHKELGYELLDNFSVNNNKRPGHGQAKKNKDITVIYSLHDFKEKYNFSLEDLFE